jgi:hypothetical protein
MSAALRLRHQTEATDSEETSAPQPFPIEDRDGRTIINPHGRVMIEIFTHEAAAAFTYQVKNNGKIVASELRGLPTWERTFIYAAGKMLECGLVELPRSFASSTTRITAVDLDDRKLVSIRKHRGRCYILLGAVLRDDGEDQPRRWQGVGDDCPKNDESFDTPMEALLSMASHLIKIGKWK